MKRVVLLICMAVVAGWFVVSSAYAVAVEVVSIKKITDGGNFDTPQWSPDGKKIYALGPNGSIVVMNADGTGFQALHEGDGYFRKFTVSPDGTKILFEYHENKESHSNLWLMHNDGSNKVKIYDDAGDPTWSPDGLKMAFWNSGVVLAGSDGSNVERLTSGGGWPVFLDNSTIAYLGDGINIINTKGQEVGSYQIQEATKIISGADRIYFDSSEILYLDLKSGKVVELVVMEPAGDESNYYPEAPTISPDGKIVAYNFFFEDGHAGPDYSTSDIWLINADGTQKSKITNTPELGEISPSWSPDGKKLVFVGVDVDGNYDLYVLVLKLQ